MNSTVTEKIEMPSGIVDMAECVGTELVRKIIMDVLLDNYGTKVGMRYGSKGTSMHSPHSSPASQLRGWDDRIAYFMGIMRKLGYSNDEDEYLPMLFPEKWRIGQVYAKNFVRLTKKDLSAIFKRIHSLTIKRELLNKEKKGEEEDEELFQVNINAAKTSKRVETFLDEVFFCPDDEIMKLPGDDEKYDQFKGQFLQYFEQFLGLPLIQSFKSIRQSIAELCDLKVENCTCDSLSQPTKGSENLIPMITRYCRYDDRRNL